MTILKLAGICLVALAMAGGALTGRVAAAPDQQGGGSATGAPVDPRVAKLKALVDADVSSPAMFDLGQQMNDAIFSFGEIGFPNERNEDWKYTSVAPIVRTPFQLAPSGGAWAENFDSSTMWS